MYSQHIPHYDELEARACPPLLKDCLSAKMLCILYPRHVDYL